MSKALVVDDSRATRMILGRTLSQMGYEVAQAGTALEAQEILNRGPDEFAVALIDWNMPEVDGLELLRRLRKDPRFANLVIVMVTTETEMEHMAAALESGANEYVMKPFTPEILRDKLQLTGSIPGKVPV